MAEQIGYGDNYLKAIWEMPVHASNFYRSYRQIPDQLMSFVSRLLSIRLFCSNLGYLDRRE